jgi:hypothetical protein
MPNVGWMDACSTDIPTYPLPLLAFDVDVSRAAAVSAGGRHQDRVYIMYNMM